MVNGMKCSYFPIPPPPQPYGFQCWNFRTNYGGYRKLRKRVGLGLSYRPAISVSFVPFAVTYTVPVSNKAFQGGEGGGVKKAGGGGMHRGGRGDARASCASPLGTPLARLNMMGKFSPCNRFLNSINV